ncbi:MAG: Nif3-like dinuclear metal center hexameric protein [Lachnospiraceae bacterium]|nr:Nif3-like dinuclear metal center hexameric protein [Lachnospiraceae bacterium]
MSLKCSDIINILEELAPLYIAEDWDNPGLIIGNRNKTVENILIALDATNAVVDEAISKDVDLIITHHPLIFGAIKKVNSDSSLGNVIMKLIKNDIAVYSAHTNLDIAKGGTNDALAELLTLKNVRMLKETGRGEYYKVAVYTPRGFEEKMVSAICQAGAGHIGRYSDCTFRSEGNGTFKAGEDTNPFIGEKGSFETVLEYKIESVVKKESLQDVIKAMLDVHPYEEPAYDIYKLKGVGEAYGIGRIGELESELSFGDFALNVKKRLGLDALKLTGSLDKRVNTVALCTGSGFEYYDEAVSLGADVYITADVRYHDAQKAVEKGVPVIDATHYASENIIVPVLCKHIKSKAGKIGEVSVFASCENGQTFKYI